MSRKRLTRRRFLATTALAGAGVGVLGRAAFAFTEEAAPAATAELYLEAKKACSNRSSYHAQLVAEAEAMMEGQKLSAEDRQVAIDALRCPICGCQAASV